ncbi:stage III sporulation protein AF [Bacillus testis]|uniref:stage III sporulation protein AF n=1 Tax=Bacillus testis TaxID=1622072 RepID=UPI00067F6B68|nr:stage III sporulation protein AF [Bacillus testis]
MEFLTDWIKNIIIFILLATVMDMLLPSSAMQKYAKMVVGLLLITVLLSPVFKLLSANFDELLAQATRSGTVENNKMEIALSDKKKEIQAANNAYILDEMAVQLKKEGEEELIKQYNYEFKHIDVSVKPVDNPQLPKDLAGIKVVLAPNRSGAVEAVRPVDIDTDKDPADENAVRSEAIKQFLGEQWGVDEAKIQIGFERRDT